jgi:hypothetical protein
LLKRTLAPLLIALATLVARRWGPKIGGVVVGLPLSSGPIFLFLAIDQGLDFAERATVGILFGMVGFAGFALIYAAVSQSSGWLVSRAQFAIAYFVVSAGINRDRGKGLATSVLSNHQLAHSIHEGVQEGMMGGDEAVGLA